MDNKALTHPQRQSESHVLIMFTSEASAVCRLLHWTEICVSPYELRDLTGADVIITYCLNENLPNGEIPYQGSHLALYQFKPGLNG